MILIYSFTRLFLLDVIQLFLHPFIHSLVWATDFSVYWTKPDLHRRDSIFQFVGLWRSNFSNSKSLATKKETYRGRWAFAVYKTCLCMTDWMNMSFNMKLCPGLNPPNSFLTPVSVIGSLFHIKLNLKHLLCWQNGCAVVINQLIVLVLICMQCFCVNICEESLYCFTWEFIRNAMLCCLWSVKFLNDAVIPTLVSICWL